jgi:hypothetical protein
LPTLSFYDGLCPSLWDAALSGLYVSVTGAALFNNDIMYKSATPLKLNRITAAHLITLPLLLKGEDAVLYTIFKQFTFHIINESLINNNSSTLLFSRHFKVLRSCLKSLL